MNEIKYLIWKGTAWVSHSSPSQALWLRLHAHVSESVPTLLLFHLPPPTQGRCFAAGKIRRAEVGLPHFAGFSDIQLGAMLLFPSGQQQPLSL